VAIEERSGDVSGAGTETRPRPGPTESGRGPREVIRTLIPRLFRPIDNASLTFFRIAFGLTTFFHVWGVLDAGRVRRRYIDPPFLFTFPGLDWVKRLPGDWMLVLWFALAAAAVLIMLGLFYRSAIIFFFVGHTYAIHLDQSIFWNHYYVVSLVAFLMIFIPANRAHSLDVMLKRVPPADTVPAWSLWILRGQMAITYFFAGVAKINSDWLRGRPMDQYLTGERSFPFTSTLFDQHWVHLALSWTGIGFDLLIVPLLLWRRTRVLAFILVLIFHFTNSLVFDIEVFPWFAIVATSLFFAPDFPRRIGLWNNDSAPDIEHRAVPQGWFQLRPRQKLGAVFMAVYFVIQIVMPLRHYAYPGDVNWTAEGDLWAWRMLLVESKHKSVFTVQSKATGAECRLDPMQFIDEAHWDKLGYRPDMMVQFARRVADSYWQRKHERVAVHIYSAVSANGDPFAALVSPETDLAGVKRSPHNQWILPRNPPTPPVTPLNLPACRP
jgi:vitamin K-dependent gamma-carboxylase